jgi:hypothetical protein
MVANNDLELKKNHECPSSKLLMIFLTPLPILDWQIVNLARLLTHKHSGVI